ncbi:GDYXXLXY domain-containing protein [Bacillaceae bacterium W0354]
MMRKRLLIVTVTLQVLLLAGMTASSYLIEKFGDIIELQTEPYDPRDVFYGDYVQLNYVAERIRPENWFASGDVKNNQVIYILLTPNENGIYQVKAASDKRMDAHGDEVVMKGRYLYQDYENVHHVNLGVNRFYIEQNSGEKFDRHQGRMVVTIALSPWGQKKILSVEEVE